MFEIINNTEKKIEELDYLKEYITYVTKKENIAIPFAILIQSNIVILLKMINQSNILIAPSE